MVGLPIIPRAEGGVEARSPLCPSSVIEWKLKLPGVFSAWIQKGCFFCKIKKNALIVLHVED